MAPLTGAEILSKDERKACIREKHLPGLGTLFDFAPSLATEVTPPSARASLRRSIFSLSRACFSTALIMARLVFR